jgi:hypothetical protein
MKDTILNYVMALLVNIVFFGCIILLVVGDFQ